jgi:cyclase
VTGSPAAGPQLTEVADGIYAFVQLPGGWCVSNAGLISGDDGLIIVDTAATQRRSAQLRRAAAALGAGPRRFVVNTHHHGDHTFGNHLFGPEATIIAHELAAREMTETGLALTQIWPDVDWGDIRVTLPSLTFRERLTLVLGGRTVELIHVGPAHTTNDVVVWLPESRVLFAGDVVFSGGTPFALMGSISGSLGAIERLSSLNPRTVVCGHGPVADAQVLAQNSRYLRWIVHRAQEGLAAGYSPLEAAMLGVSAEFAGLLDQERVVGNLHRAYGEQSGRLRPGAPIDVPSVFDEMVKYNGGNRPTCLA